MVTLKNSKVRLDLTRKHLIEHVSGKKQQQQFLWTDETEINLADWRSGEAAHDRRHTRSSVKYMPVIILSASQ